jgi:ribosome-associated protein
LLDSIDKAKKIVETVSDKQAEDIILLDVQHLTTIADYFVILSGSTSRQIKAIYDEIIDKLKKWNINLLRSEGEVGAGWLLMDYGDVIVHIFSPIERNYYKLDEVWQKAHTILRIQ